MQQSITLRRYIGSAYIDARGDCVLLMVMMIMKPVVMTGNFGGNDFNGNEFGLALCVVAKQIEPRTRKRKLSCMIITI